MAVQRIRCIIRQEEGRTWMRFRLAPPASFRVELKREGWQYAAHRGAWYLLNSREG
jgi:hypothetical protein